MCATAGKVALVTNTTTLTCGAAAPPTPASSTSSATATRQRLRGARRRPALTNTTAGLRDGGGCLDTDNNAADFTAGAPNPQQLRVGRPRHADRRRPTLTRSTTSRARRAPLAAGRASGRRRAGIVTADAPVNGFWMQDPAPDADPPPARASSSSPAARRPSRVGDAVQRRGTVSEFRPGGAPATNLTPDRDHRADDASSSSSGNALPAAGRRSADGGRAPARP